jgi:hypothetical protein
LRLIEFSQLKSTKCRTLYKMSWKLDPAIIVLIPGFRALQKFDNKFLTFFTSFSAIRKKSHFSLPAVHCFRWSSIIAFSVSCPSFLRQTNWILTASSVEDWAFYVCGCPERGHLCANLFGKYGNMYGFPFASSLELENFVKLKFDSVEDWDFYVHMWLSRTWTSLSEPFRRTVSSLLRPWHWRTLW